VPGYLRIGEIRLQVRLIPKRLVLLSYSYRDAPDGDEVSPKSPSERLVTGYPGPWELGQGAYQPYWIGTLIEMTPGQLGMLSIDDDPGDPAVCTENVTWREASYHV
jgi:hypothetical protein